MTNTVVHPAPYIDGLVLPFGLPIGLWVEGGQHVTTASHVEAKAHPLLCCKKLASVSYQDFWHAMMLYYISNKHLYEVSN